MRAPSRCARRGAARGHPPPVLRRDDDVEYEGEVRPIREHPGERGEGVGKTHLAITLGLVAAGRRYEHGSIILTANKSYGEWAEVFSSDAVIATAILDRLLHHSTTISIKGESYRLKDRKKAGLTALPATR